MLDLRPVSSLGLSRTDWLHSLHHFSFAEYLDRRRMAHGNLRVWNDDIIAPNTGFPMHGHQDMEIITYVFSGAITHKDSLGNLGRTEAGQVQVMSAGTGILHSEFNADAVPTHLFQIWIKPAQRGTTPHWETRPVPRTQGRFECLASGWPEDQDVPQIGQNARLCAATLMADTRLTHDLPGRNAYLVAAKGRVLINGATLSAGDGLAISDEKNLAIQAQENAELVLVELSVANN